MRYGKLSNAVIVSEKEGSSKMNAQDYVNEIMDKELFDFWITSMEDVGNVLVMEDGAPYHQGVAPLRRQIHQVHFQTTKILDQHRIFAHTIEVFLPLWHSNLSNAILRCSNARTITNKPIDRTLPKIVPRQRLQKS